LGETISSYALGDVISGFFFDDLSFLLGFYLGFDFFVFEELVSAFLVSTAG